MERVISLKAWFATIATKWKGILVCALIGAIVLGGKYAYQNLPSKQQETKTEESSEDKNLRKQFDQVNDRIEGLVGKQNEYILDSLKTRIDPMREGRATVILRIRTAALEQDKNAAVGSIGIDDEDAGKKTAETTILTPALRKANQILAAYEDAIETGIDWTALAEKLETKPEYLQELISVKETDESNVKLKIIVIHPEKDKATEILDAVIGQLETKKEQITSQFGAHDLIFDEKNAAVVVDDTLMRWLNERLGDINQLITSQDNYKVNINSTAQQQPAATVMTKSVFIKQTVKAGVKGAILGVIASVFIYGLYLLFSKRVLSAKDLANATGLKKLVVLPDAKLASEKGLSRLASSLFLAEQSSAKEATAYAIAYENLHGLVKAGAVIGVAGDVSEEMLKEICIQIEANAAETGIRLMSFENLAKNPAALKQLSNCDGVILVAKRYESRYNRIVEIIESVTGHGQKLLGTIYQ